MIDWSDPSEHVTDHFTVKDCLFLHHWNRLATIGDGANLDALVRLCEKLEDIRGILACPMNVHCMFRSPEYNRMIGAPTTDVHSMSQACDFDCLPDLSSDAVKLALRPHLEILGIRMEDNGPNSSWVHIDIHPVGRARFFLP